MPYRTALPDTLFVGGTDLQTVAGIVVGSLVGLLAPGRRRGQPDVIPGRPGAVGAELPYDSFEMPVPITVLCENSAGARAATAQGRKAQMDANLRAVAALCAGTNGLVTLKRRISDSATTYREDTCNAQFLGGLAQQLLNAVTGKTELVFLNLDGSWLAADTVTRVVP